MNIARVKYVIQYRQWDRWLDFPPAAKSKYLAKVKAAMKEFTLARPEISFRLVKRTHTITDEALE